MDEKLVPDGELPPPASSSTSHQQKKSASTARMWMRIQLGAIAILLSLFFVLAHMKRTLELQVDSEGRIIRPGQVALTTQHVADDDVKVPLDIHIMSKCPDALDCLAELIVPAMSLTAPKVHLNVSYIGTPTDPDDGVLCKHGPSECLGNIIELCAATLYPDPKQYLGFTLCMTREYERIPEMGLVKNCALEYGISFEKLNECASRDEGSYGMGLLRSSVRYSKAVNASVSCTVRLDGKERCIRDGGEWKSCEGGSRVKDLVGDIEKLWAEKNGKEE